MNRRRGGREAERFGEGAVDLLSFAGRFPFAVNRAEPARKQHTARRVIYDFEKILPAVRVVDRPRRIARPGQRLENVPVEAEALLFRIAGMVEVDAQRLRPGRADGNQPKPEEPGKGFHLFLPSP